MLFLAITVSSSVLILFALVYFVFYLWYSLVHRSRTSPFDSTAPLKLQRFSYKEVKSAANGFDAGNAIGKGGSGTVFRGVLRDGKSVAIKKLDATSFQAEREFQNELMVLGGLRSPFVVSLLGYCAEKGKRILVYEYMPNRSLQEALFRDGNLNMTLNWEQRFEVINDVARALAFLHLECDPPVIHGDVKPSNVLLDSDYRAKISDFGLSRSKMEGEFGVEMFSQELGRSQELWKSQDMSGNLAFGGGGGGGGGGAETPATADSAHEVDFALALQASSSSKNSRSFYNVKSLSLNSLNYNANMASVSDLKMGNGNGKGKEVSTGGDDWNKFVAYDDEPCSIEHSKELNGNISSVLDDVSGNSGGGSKQWGKDWWWRQDGSGELCSKDYVMEWIGSQICPSANPDWEEEEKKTSPSLSPEKPKKPENSNLKGSIQFEDKMEESQLGEVGVESRSKGLETIGNPGWKSRTCKKKHRKMQEWWKEEHLAEISKKGAKINKIRKMKKLETRWKKGFKMAHLDLSRRFHLRRRRRKFDEQNENEYDPNMEFSFRRGWRKKNTPSAGSEMWSGDLFSRELSSTTSMRGTLCYVAPEYGGCGYLMEKADIYSLGVLILVIVSGRRPLHVLSSPMKLEKANLISWCRQLAQVGNILELVDERLKDGYSKDEASLCINLALTCLQKIPELRPDIGEIVKILKGEMDLPPLPFEFSPSPSSKLFSRSRRKHNKASAGSETPAY